MYVYVDRSRIQRQIETEDGLALAVQHVLIGGLDGMHERLVAHIAAIDEKVLPVRTTAGDGRNAGESSNRHAVLLGRHLAVLSLEGSGHQRLNAVNDVRGGRKLQNIATVCRKREANVGVGERQTLEIFGHMSRFRRVGLHELAASRRLVEKVEHLHARADDACGGMHLSVGDLPCAVGLRRAAADAHLGNGIDRRQGLAAKAEASDALELKKVADLAGGVPSEG